MPAIQTEEHPKPITVEQTRKAAGTAIIGEFFRPDGTTSFERAVIPHDRIEFFKDMMDLIRSRTADEIRTLALAGTPVALQAALSDAWHNGSPQDREEINAGTHPIAQAYAKTLPVKWNQCQWESGVPIPVLTTTELKAEADTGNRMAQHLYAIRAWNLGDGAEYSKYLLLSAKNGSVQGAEELSRLLEWYASQTTDYGRKATALIEAIFWQSFAISTCEAYARLMPEDHKNHIDDLKGGHADACRRLATLARRLADAPPPKPEAEASEEPAPTPAFEIAPEAG